LLTHICLCHQAV